jgi:transcriptional regulator with XRE-family HTH domain
MTTGRDENTGMIRRQLGKKLKRLREEAGRTHEDVAESGRASTTTMWRVETGKVAVRDGLVWELGDYYNLPHETTRALVQFAAGTRGKDYSEVEGMPEWLGLYRGLEAGASQIRTYHPELVIGFVQTADYARTIIRAGNPKILEDAIEQRVNFRMERQQTVLEGSPARQLHVILGAGALSMVIGSPSIMAAQVEHLRELQARGLVTVKILPWTAGAHPATDGAFTILDFDDPDDPTLIHFETYLGAKYDESPSQVDRFRAIFQALNHLSIPIKEFTP